jgi:hypothetical protein
MIFRTNTGELVEINRYSFKNDKLYYEKLVSIKKPLTKANQFTVLSKLDKTFGSKN